MKLAFMRILFAFVTAVAMSGAMLSQDPYILRVDVPLVSVDFTVRDNSGRAVTNLGREDFEVFDDGEPRPIQNFAPVDTPYNILLLLDCSESTRDRLNLMLSSMGEFSKQLRRQDHSAVAVFGTEVNLMVDWNGEKNKSFRITESPGCNGTNFYSGVRWAEKKLQAVRGRRGIIVFSDGVESNVERRAVDVGGVKVRQIVPPSEDGEFQKLLKTVRSSGAPIYVVAVDTDLNPGAEYNGSDFDLKQSRGRLEELARNSGGRVAFPREAKDVVPLFLQIGKDLGVSYSLAFTPARSKAGASHKIEIRARGPEYHVHQTRDTYTTN